MRPIVEPPNMKNNYGVQKGDVTLFPAGAKVKYSKPSEKRSGLAFIMKCLNRYVIGRLLLSVICSMLE